MEDIVGRRKSLIPGMSFSWKRAVGLSAAKGRLSRQIGVPLTRSGRQRKFGAAAGCCFLAALLGFGIALAAATAVACQVR